MKTVRFIALVVATIVVVWWTRNRSPSRSASPTAPTPVAVKPGPHPHALLSFAVSRDGRMLATGSEAPPDEHADEPSVGAVLWNLDTLTPAHAVPVRGGVGLGDQLRGGLKFSASGKLVGVNFHTCAVGAIDAASGELVLDWGTMGWDQAPTFSIADDDSRLFLGYGGDHCKDSFGLLAPARGGVVDKPACLEGASGRGDLSAVSLRGSVVHGVTHKHELVSVDANKGTVLRSMPLLANPGQGENARFRVVASPSGRFAAASASDIDHPTNTGTSVIDLDTGNRIFQSDSLGGIQGFVFDAAEKRWAGVGSNDGRPGVADWIALFEADRSLGRITGPFEEINWLRFADGLPFCFSPTGERGLVLRPGGVIELFQLGRAPRRERGLATVPGTRGLAWPREDLAIAIGPRVLAFLDVPSGKVIAQYSFPP